MSTLYLGTDLDSLAGKLAELHAANADDFFVPVPVAVSSPYLGKWLRMWLARKLGVVINFRFLHLERAMWEMLKTLDGRPPSPPLELLSDSDYRVMVLAALLDAESGARISARCAIICSARAANHGATSIAGPGSLPIGWRGLFGIMNITGRKI